MATLRMLTEVITVVRFDVDAMRRGRFRPGAAGHRRRRAPRRQGRAVSRGAHASSVRWWRSTIAAGRTLADLDLDEWRAASDRFDPSVVDLFDPDAALRRRDVPGGPGPRSVTRQLTRGRALVARTRKAAAGG